MYLDNLVLELFYFILLVGGCFGVLCLIIVGMIKAIASAIGYEIVRISNWLNKWANN